MAMAAVGLVALVVAARIYRSFLPATQAAEVGGCGFLFVCGSAIAGLIGGAIWIWRREDD